MNPRLKLAQTVKRAEHRRSEIAERIAELSGQDLDGELSDEERSEYGSLQEERVRVERAAREAQANLEALADDTASVSGAQAGQAGQAELVTLHKRAAGEGGVRGILDAVKGRPQGCEVPGALGELLAHTRSENTPQHDRDGWLLIPHAALDALEYGPEAEHKRADDPTISSDLGTSGAPRNVRSIQPRVFRMPTLARFGLMNVEMVPAGEDITSFINAGVSADTITEETAATATTITLTTKTLGPSKFARARYRLSDGAMHLYGAGLRPAFDQDARMGMAVEMEGEVWGIIQAAVTDADDATAELTFTAAASSAAAFVDGTYALTEGDVSFLIGTDSYQKLGELRSGAAAAGDNAGGVSGLAELSGRVGMLLASGLIAAMDAGSKNQANLAYRPAHGSPVRVVAWDAVSAIVDPYTDSASGITNITFSQVWNAWAETTRRTALSEFRWQLKA